METVKTRKQGNAVMVTIASQFNVPAGTTYYITKEKDGTILLIPKVEDYFANASAGQFIDEEDVLAKNIMIKGNDLDD
ncbi:type II toxin-antitoxin system PemI/MazE family antitoxin [Candidatus Enterococcus ferrettii]|uniref:AbrB family transcriptional regulator n=1 Tax=Candidatus Enterococcus ferrettii TaxID=2815324 RepID=A0ABV0EQC3_9ENTE|nr:AbrB family transcriptional regulator [Enterococcus sp. 665A]MBO1341434.1 AbrB family transcriptional regulator [Enterococcus sp. 665A]